MCPGSCVRSAKEDADKGTSGLIDSIGFVWKRNCTGVSSAKTRVCSSFSAEWSKGRKGNWGRRMNIFLFLGSWDAARAAKVCVGLKKVR